MIRALLGPAEATMSRFTGAFPPPPSNSPVSRRLSHLEHIHLFSVGYLGSLSQ